MIFIWSKFQTDIQFTIIFTTPDVCTVCHHEFCFECISTHECANAEYIYVLDLWVPLRPNELYFYFLTYITYSIEKF